jgi:hypothetical protein
VPARELSFQETKSGGSYEWHQDPVPRFVLTLSGTLEFQTKSGATFTIRPGDVLLAQDNTGTGHKWKLVGDDPWRRAYVVYENGADLHFTSSRRTKAALIERVADEVIGGADPAQGSGLTGRTPGARRMPSALPP